MSASITDAEPPEFCCQLGFGFHLFGMACHGAYAQRGEKWALEGYCEGELALVTLFEKLELPLPPFLVAHGAFTIEKLGICHTNSKTKFFADLNLVIPFSDEVQLSIMRVELEYASASDDTHSPSAWRLAAALRLAIPGHACDTVKLECTYESDKWSVNAEVDAPPISVSPAEGTRLEVQLRRLSLGFGAGDFELEFAACIRLVHLPLVLLALLPGPLGEHLQDGGVEATLKVSNHGVTVEVDKLLALVVPVTPLKIPVRFCVSPDADKSLDLGTAAVDVTTLKITLAKEPSLSVAFGLALPSRLNEIFGKDQKGAPEHSVFRVYDGGTQSFMSFEATFSTKGIGFSLVKGSPIQSMNIDKGKWKVTLGDGGEYGEFSIVVPEIGFRGAMFDVTGGYTIEKPLAIPLAPLKELLRNFGLKDLAEALPPKVPIPMELDLVEVDPKDGRTKLVASRIVDRMQKMLPGANLHPIASALHTLSDRVDELPERMLDYLHLHIPDEMKFTLAVTPDGGVNFSIHVGKKETDRLRLLYPVIDVLPSLQGIALKEISFGEVLGGSLFLLRLTADFDRFDVASLAASLALQGMKVPVSKDFHNHVIVNDLWCFVIYETGVPIPIPVFYKELGIDYLGVEGVGVQAHVQFPMPSFLDIAKAGVELFSFFSNKEKELDPRDPPKFFPEFSIKDCYVELPEYLGGKRIGQQPDEPVVVSLNEKFAELLNGIKFMRVADLLAVIPLSLRANRIGGSLGDGEESDRVEVSKFGPLSMSASWLIAAPSELVREDVYSRIGAADKDEARALLSLAPVQIDVETPGLVVFLRGEWEVLGSGVDCRFALVALDSRHFATGFRFTGKIRGLLSVDLGGHVVIDPPDTPFEIEGHGRTTFEIAGLPVFQGQAQVRADDSSFSLEGQLAVLEKTWPVHASGQIKGSLTGESIELAGSVTAQFLILAGSADASINGDGVHLDMKLANERVALLSLTENEGLAELRGSLRLFRVFECAAVFTLNATNPESVEASGTLDVNLVGGLVQLHVVFDLRAGQTVSFEGSARLVAFKHTVYERGVRLNDTHFDFDGHVQLFADGSPINVIGDATARGDETGLTFDGDLSSKIGFISLDETASLVMNPTEMSVSGRWMAQDVTLDLAQSGNGLAGHLAAHFGLCAIDVEAIVRSPTGLGLVLTTSNLGGGVVMRGEFAGRSGDGKLTLFVLGQALSSGTIHWDERGFKLSASVTFGLQTNTLSGRLDTNGIELGVGFKVGGQTLPWPFSWVTLPEFSYRLQLGQSGFEVAGSVPGFSWKGDLTQFNGGICTLIELTGVCTVYVVLPLGGVPWISLTRPSGWP